LNVADAHITIFIKDFYIMADFRGCMVAAVLIGAIGVGGALAQAPTPSAVPKSSLTTPAQPVEPSTSVQVEKWTNKQWSTMKTKWAREKVKWADCRQQSSDQKLEGRKSWSFLYSCMT
jgi:hypothetical protein